MAGETERERQTDREERERDRGGRGGERGERRGEVHMRAMDTLTVSYVGGIVAVCHP